jgi:hypothetical protein
LFIAGIIGRKIMETIRMTVILSIICLFSFTSLLISQSVNLSNATLTVPAGKELRGVLSKDDLGYGVIKVTIRILQASAEKDGTIIFDQSGQIKETQNLKEQKQVKLILSDRIKPEMISTIENGKLLGWTQDGLVLETRNQEIIVLNPLNGNSNKLNFIKRFFKVYSEFEGSVELVRDKK